VELVKGGLVDPAPSERVQQIGCGAGAVAPIPAA
jgi:hypothetical protein